MKQSIHDRKYSTERWHLLSGFTKLVFRPAFLHSLNILFWFIGRVFLFVCLFLLLFACWLTLLCFVGDSTGMMGGQGGEQKWGAWYETLKDSINKFKNVPFFPLSSPKEPWWQHGPSSGSSHWWPWWEHGPVPGPLAGRILRLRHLSSWFSQCRLLSYFSNLCYGILFQYRYRFHDHCHCISFWDYNDISPFLFPFFNPSHGPLLALFQTQVSFFNTCIMYTKYIHTHTHIYTCKYIVMCAYIYTHICVYTYKYICICVNM